MRGPLHPEELSTPTSWHGERHLRGVPGLFELSPAGTVPSIERLRELEAAYPAAVFESDEAVMKAEEEDLNEAARLWHECRLWTREGEGMASEAGEKVRPYSQPGSAQPVRGPSGSRPLYFIRPAELLDARASPSTAEDWYGAEGGTPQNCSTSSSELQLASKRSSRKARPTPSMSPRASARRPT